MIKGLFRFTLFTISKRAPSLQMTFDCCLQFTGQLPTIDYNADKTLTPPIEVSFRIA